MKDKEIFKVIGSHKGTINALQLNLREDRSAEIVSLDEDGVIQIHESNGSFMQIELSK